MGGLGALLVIGVYLVIAYKVIRAIKGQKARYVAVAFFVLLPTADAIVGRLYLTYLCATEGGAKTHRVIENVDGFRDETGPAHPTDYRIKQGYQFVEGPLLHDGNVNRLSLREGASVREQDVPPKSMYRFYFMRIGERELFERNRHVVEVMGTREILAEHTQIVFAGGWGEQLLAGFTDAGVGSAAWCNADKSAAERGKIINTLLLETLKPQKQ